MSLALLAGLILLLLIAAWWDLAVRLIPDRLPFGILLLALLLRGAEGLMPLLGSLAAAAVLFAMLLLPAMRGWLGGGDVKLAAALAVALPPAAVPDFAIATALAGGVLGLGYLIGPRLAPRLGTITIGSSGMLARVMAVEARRLGRRGPVPYGVAIAAGGVMLLLRTQGQ